MAEKCLFCLSPFFQGRQERSFSSLLKCVGGGDERDMNDIHKYAICSECEGTVDNLKILQNFNSHLKSKLEEDIKEVVGLILRSEGNFVENAELKKMRQSFMDLMGGHMLKPGPTGRVKKLTQCLFCLSRFPLWEDHEKRSLGSLLNLVRKVEKIDKGAAEFFVLCSECEKLENSASKFWRSILQGEQRQQFVIGEVRELILESEGKEEVAGELAYMREAFMELSGGKLTKDGRNKESQVTNVATSFVQTPIEGNPSIESQTGNSKSKNKPKNKPKVSVGSGTETTPRRSNRVIRKTNDDNFVYGSEAEQEEVDKRKRPSLEHKSKKVGAEQVPELSQSF